MISHSEYWHVVIYPEFISSLMSLYAHILCYSAPARYFEGVKSVAVTWLYTLVLHPLAHFLQDCHSSLFLSSTIFIEIFIEGSFKY